MALSSRYLALFLVAVGCTTPPAPGSDYFDRQIAPILNTSCASTTSACHKDDGNGFAMGNLDLSSFEATQQRQDVLRRYGAYPEPLLLIKAVASTDLDVSYRDEYRPLEIVHAGGAVLQPGTQAYITLKQWLDNGATRSGRPPAHDGNTGTGSCSQVISAGVDPSVVTQSDPGFAEFAVVQDYLVPTCGAGSCHGSVRADFHLTCGQSDDEIKANYLMTRAFIAPTVDDSPLLTKALDPQNGGTYHSGGVFFPSRDDGSYTSVRDWAATSGTLPEGNKTAARLFFDDNVMPIFLQRGCAVQSCHSPIVPFKVNLRAGSVGFFSPLALDVNYREARKFLGLESPNPLASRIVDKNIVQAKGGIAHRAGAVLETPGATSEPQSCAPPYDAATATPLCTLAEWRRLERMALPASWRSNLTPGSTAPVVYVARPADAVRFVDFSSYRPGADLLGAVAQIGPGSALTSLGGGITRIDSCPGVSAGDRSNIDVRSPEPSYDGTRVLFAMRIGQGSGLNLYEVGVDGQGCRQLTSDGGQNVNGITVHNFDPFYVVDDTDVEWVVYASTRAGARTPKLFLPGADLWRQPVLGGTPERMTYLRGVQAQPFQMNNGMVGMSVEKASAEFYQVAGRRLNWDLSDFHPLLGQRSSSYQGRDGYVPGEVPQDAVRVPSIGYSQATEIRQAHNGNFLVILADAGAYGEGGVLGLFNRSVGPFEAGRDEPGFVKALSILGGATGRAGESAGAYRSPYPLPDSTVLASYAASADIGSTVAKRYDLVVVDPVSGSRRVLLQSAQSLVEAVLVSPRPPPHPFTREPSTEEAMSTDYAVLHYTDLPLLATLQGANDRRGRHVDELRLAARVRYFTHQDPPATCTSPSHPDCAPYLTGTQSVYESRVDMGSSPLSSDGSAFLRVPTKTPLFLELLDGNGQVIYRMQEETQFGPFENINLAVPESAYPTLCAICHGSVSGRELDIRFEVDVITTASLSEARSAGIRDLQ